MIFFPCFTKCGANCWSGGLGVLFDEKKNGTPTTRPTLFVREQQECLYVNVVFVLVLALFNSIEEKSKCFCIPRVQFFRLKYKYYSKSLLIKR